MLDIKTLAKNEIERKRDEVYNEYNDRITALEDLDSVASVMYLVTRTFGNCNEQKEILVEIINKSFTSKFVSQSQIHPKTNDIIISNDKFFISIPTSYLKSISIGRIEEPRAPICPTSKGEEEYYVKYYELYKDNPSKENYDYLVTYYIEYVVRERPTFFNKRKVEQEELSDHYEKCKNKIEAHEYNLKRWAEEMEEYKEVEMEDLKFLEETKEDIRPFLEEKWTIKYENLNEKSVRTHKELNKGE